MRVCVRACGLVGVHVRACFIPIKQLCLLWIRIDCAVNGIHCVTSADEEMDSGHRGGGVILAKSTSLSCTNEIFY